MKLVVVVVVAALLVACGKGSSTKKPCDELKAQVCASGGCEGLDEYLSENGVLSDEEQQVQCKVFLSDPDTIEAMKSITSMSARGKPAPGPVKRYALFARFRDASGLAKGTKVVVKGVPVGEVTGSEPLGKLSRVTFELDGSVVVKRGGKLTRKQSTTLGENVLELEPGEGEPLGPACGGYDDKDRAVADRCREVTHVIEATLPPG